MSEFLRIITHARRFKSAVKEVGVEQLEEIKKKLEKIIEDRVEEEVAAQQENQEKLEKIEKIREMMAADGISPHELDGLAASRKGKRAPRPPKYEIWNEKGEHITWTGQGRMPNVFKARLEEGESLDTFLIES